MEQETISGFDIPKRELTEEEKNRTITLDRFQNFHYDAGEDFLDTTGDGDHKIFCGWLMAKYPQASLEILEYCNKAGKYGEINTFNECSMFDNDPSGDIFYTDVAEFANLTEHFKHRVNEVLIILDEYYN